MCKLLFWILLVMPLMVSASPYIEIGTVNDVLPDQTVAVPVQFLGDETAVSLQFDIFFDSQQFSAEDLDSCEFDIDDKFWANCQTMPAPNGDVIRVHVVGGSLGVIPSGDLLLLKFKASAQAVQKTSALHIDKCSPSVYDRAGTPYQFLANRLTDGSITVDSQFVDEPEPPPVYRLITEYAESDEPLPYIAKAFYNVKFDQELKFGPEQMLLDFPGKMDSIVNLHRFAPKEGFVPRVGCSDQMLVDPEAPYSDFQYHWYGVNWDDGQLSQVSITIYNGSVEGSIWVSGSAYRLTGNPVDGFGLLEYDLSKLPPAHPPYENDTVPPVPTTSFFSRALLVIAVMLLGMLWISNGSTFQ